MPNVRTKSQPVPRGTTATSGRRVDPDEPVRDLVDRPVATDDDEQPRAGERRLARELGEVPRPLAEERVALEPGRRGPPRELGPAAPGRPVRRRRVDEEDVLGRLASAVMAVTVASASSVIWSTAFRISSSVMRTNSPSTTTSRHDQHAAGLDLAQRPEREEHGGLHLDREDPAVGPAPRQALVGLVEDVARDDRADADRLAELLRLMHRLVDEPEVGCRRVRLAADVVDRGRVGGVAESAMTSSPIVMSGCSPPHVPTRMIFLTPSWTSSSITIAADGQPMPLDWTETGLPLKVPGVAEHPALAVSLDDVLQERLGDVLGPERVAGKEAGLGVVARLARTWIGMGGSLRRCS